MTKQQKKKLLRGTYEIPLLAAAPSCAIAAQDAAGMVRHQAHQSELTNAEFSRRNHGVSRVTDSPYCPRKIWGTHPDARVRKLGKKIAEIAHGKYGPCAKPEMLLRMSRFVYGKPEKNPWHPVTATMAEMRATAV